MIKVSNGPGVTGKIFTTVKNLARQKSPELLVVAGVAAFAGTLYSMYKSTVKIKDIVDDANTDIEVITSTEDKIEEYTTEDAAEDIKKIKKVAAKDIVKAAAPTVLLAIGTLSCFLGADYIRRQRHAALFAASEMTLRAYNNYRKGVIDKFGEDVDRELKYKLYKEDIEVEETNPETGRKKKVKRQIIRTDYDGYSQFARKFDEFNDLYEKNSTPNGKEPSYGLYNLKLLTEIETRLNDRLREKGFVTINEAYDMLHFECIKAGKNAGWLWNPNDPSCRNNTHISLGLFRNKTEEDLRAIAMGITDFFIVDFNIDTLDVWESFDDTPTFGLLPGRSR